MKNKAVSAYLCCLFTFIISLGFFSQNAAGAGYTVGEVESLAGGIVGYELNTTGSDSIQDWINGSLTDNAGVSSEWFVLGLSQSGSYDLSVYEKALLTYLDDKTSLSATSREKYALALISAGSTDRYITDALADSIGQQGIMSWIYALHIMNNGYECAGHTAASTADMLISLQLSDGGWALFGSNGDIDVTAMTLQSLAPYYNTDQTVHQAADRAIDFLSRRQQPDGGYNSFGTANPESAAQVLTALSALGIDCQTDQRFLKNGCNIIDFMETYKLPDGSYCHISGGESNPTATVQAYYSYVAYQRLLQGKFPLLVLDNRSPQPQPVTTTVPVTSAAVSTTATTSAASDAPQVQSTVTNTSSDGQSATTVHTVSSTDVFRTSTLSAASASATTSALTTQAESSTSAALTENPEVSEPPTAAGTVSDSSGGGYKGKVIIIILGAAAALSLAVFAVGKRNYKNFIAIAAVSAVGIIFVLVTDFQSTDSYYNGEKKHKENAIGTVTMTIRCDTVADKLDSEYIPDDGIILDITDFDIEEGETVYDILIEAARTYRIQVENRGSSGSAHGMVYIAGINYLYEMDFGDLSGWVYHVNGVTPSRGCGDYVLSDGDRIEWLYTCELGHDLNEVYEQ